MLILDSDGEQTPYSVLQALVHVYQGNVDELKQKRAKHAPRSHTYIEMTGEIAGYNMAISTIMITNVWHIGQHKQQQVQETPHVHAWEPHNPNSGPYIIVSEAQCNTYLAGLGVTTMLEASLQHGICFEPCSKQECIG